MTIRFLESREIDRKKWNDTLDRFPTIKLYARPYFLDALSDHWGAFVTENYAFIMPVIYGKKWGIKYTYHPPFCQQLGIFSKEPLSREIKEAFIDALKAKFRYIVYRFNSENDRIENSVRSVNFILNLNEAYPALRRRFSKNTKRNINKAHKSGLSFSESTDTDEINAFARKHIHFPFSIAEFKRFEALIQAGLENQKAKILQARDDSDRLVSFIFLYRDTERIHYLLGVNSPEGKALQASFGLFNKLIEENAGSQQVLDFEGSEIPGVARFFAGWGAQKEYYSKLKINRLPFPLYLIKP